MDVVSPTQPVSVGWFESYETGPAWGMVVSGNYAYVSGLRKGDLGILSIANRMKPMLVGRISGESGPSFNFEVIPPYLYTSPWAGKIIAYDISAPDHLVEVGVFDIHDTGRFFTFARRDSLLFAAESGENAAPPGRFRVLDISNPANITQMGIYTYTPPVPVEGGLEGVVLSGNYAYVGARQYGLLVIDISDPAHPTLAGSLDIFTNQRDLAISGNYVFVSDAFGEQRGIHILDISNPISPTPVGFYNTGSANPHSFAIIGHYLYVPAGDAFRIVDVSNPALPVEVARYKGLCGNLNSVFVDWPYAYVGTQECGLYTFWFVPGVQNAPIPPSGGVLTSEADNTSYSFPPGTFTNTVLISHIPRFEGNLPPAGNLVGIGHAFEIRAVYSDTEEEAQPTGSFKIAIHYSEPDKWTVVEDSLGLYYWNGEQWIREPSSVVETFANIVTATPNHFSLWAVMGEKIPQNQPPVADAGSNQTVFFGTTVTLDASASSDPDGDSLTYEWDLDNDGQFDDAIGVTATITFSQVGEHTVGLRVTDNGGLSDTDTTKVTVLPWTLIGFYQPVDMNGVYNVVKGGSTVPLKFEIFAGSIELTNTAYVKSLSYAETSCNANAVTDEIELTTTGDTSLRYDANSGQYIYNWKTPKAPGKCYRVTVITQDGSALLAYFKIK